MRRSGPSILSQPKAIGAAALLVIVAATYVSYTATRGLPFVPQYRISAEVPDAGLVIHHTDVTMAGTRIGTVRTVRTRPRANGKPIAVLDLAIDRRYEPIPVDSTVVIRTAGSLGRKYVELTPGRSTTGLKAGGTLPLRQARPPVVDLDQLFNVFREPVRRGSRDALGGLGPGFASRGESINAAIAEFAPLLANLRVVSGTMADPRTQLARFFSALEDFAAELAPVAEQTAALFSDLDTTFAALAGVAPDLQATISETPPTFEAVTSSSARILRLLRETTVLTEDLRPGVAYLPSSSAALARALRAGTRNLPATPKLAPRLATALESVAAFGEDPVVGPGLARVTKTAASLGPPLAFITPAQTTCFYAALLIRNVASLFKDPVDTGTTVRAGAVVVGVAKNAERGPSDRPFPGPVEKALGPVHSNPYPNTASPGQPRECEAGNEPYITNRPVLGNVPGTQRTKTESPSLP